MERGKEGRKEGQVLVLRGGYIGDEGEGGGRRM